MKERILMAFEALRSGLKRVPWRRLALPAGILVGAALISVWLHLPVDAGLTYGLRTAASKADVEIGYEEAGMGLFGPTLGGLTARGPVTVTFATVRLRPRASVLWFNPGVAFSARQGDGRLSGSTGLGTSRDLDLLVEALDLMAIGLGRSLPLGLELEGRLGGTLTFEMPDGSPATTTGTTDLTLEQVRLHPGPGVPLPVEVLELGTVRIRAKANDGRVELTGIQIDGEDLHGTVRGTMRLRQPMGRTSVDIRVKLHFGDRIRGSAEAFAPMIGFRKERDAYVRTLRGQLAALL